MFLGTSGREFYRVSRSERSCIHGVRPFVVPSGTIGGLVGYCSQIKKGIPLGLYNSIPLLIGARGLFRLRERKG